MKAPFPWFGGKRRVAPDIWSAFGDVDNYVEPFAGSLAVLLERPASHSGWQTGAETVNDRDVYVANFWRATSLAPDEVARWADWPVNEADLFARHLWLVNDGRDRLARMEADPDYYDVKVAGWWLWGICAWIGSGWCSGAGPWKRDGNAGRGVKRKLPHLGDAGQGVNRQLPHLGNAGQGAAHSAGDMTSGGSGAPSAEWDMSHWRAGEPLVYGYMRALRERLRRVRVCCGDWERVVTTGALNHGATVGVLLDPPYSGEVRTADLYSTDCGEVSGRVREWAIEAGKSRRLRIALCGYEGEHAMPDDWRVLEWSASGAYVGSGDKKVAGDNRHKERIWFSPGCLQPSAQLGLFGEAK